MLIEKLKKRIKMFRMYSIIIGRLKSLVKNYLKKYKRFFIIVLIVFILLFGSFFLFFLEYTAKIDSWALQHKSFKWTDRLPLLLDLYYLPLMVKGSDLPAYRVEIDPEELNQMYQVLPSEPGCFGWDILEDNRKYEDIILNTGDKDYHGRIKIRGDCSDHWINREKSWKIKFNEGNFLEGFEETDLILASTQEYIAEELNYYRARKLGLAVAPSKFVTLYLNGDYQGVYWERKSFQRDILEISGQPSDVNLYGDMAINPKLFQDVNYWKKYSQDGVNQSDNYAELSLLLNLINNSDDDEFYEKIPLLVDLDNFYKWYVVEMLGGSYHQDYAHNIRIYFDITSGKFKFIPVDVGLSDDPANDQIFNPLVTRIMKNKKFVQDRNEILWNYVEKNKNLKDDLEKYDEFYNQIRWAIYRDLSKDHSNFYFDRKIKVRRQIVENNYLSAQALFNDDLDNINITIGPESENIFYLDVEVTNFSGVELKELELTNKDLSGNFSIYSDHNNNGQYDNDDLLIEANINSGQIKIDFRDLVFMADRYAPNNIEYLRPEEGGDPNNPYLFQLLKILPTHYRLFMVGQGIGTTIGSDDIKIKIKNAVTGKNMKENIRYINNLSFNYFNDIILEPEQFINANREFIFSDGKFILGRGSYFFDRNIIVPQGYKLIIETGTNIRMAPGISLISYSPIEADNITVSASAGESWGVLAVINSGQAESVFNNIRINNGSDAYINGIFFSGMLSAYHSDISVENSFFSGAKGDDALNIKNAKVFLNNNQFINNNFDAFDGDFINGRIKNNFFSDNGNDGIDVSGSLVTIIGNRIFNSGDKGISIGENSNVKTINNVLRNNNYGLAVKDLSEVIFVSNTVLENNIGIAAYQKKPIFDGGELRVYNSILWNNTSLLEKDDKSNIIINYSIIDQEFGETNSMITPVLNDNFELVNKENFQNIINFDWLSQENIDLDSLETIGIYDS